MIFKDVWNDFSEISTHNAVQRFRNPYCSAVLAEPESSKCLATQNSGHKYTVLWGHKDWADYKSHQSQGTMANSTSKFTPSLVMEESDFYIAPCSGNREQFSLAFWFEFWQFAGRGTLRFTKVVQKEGRRSTGTGCTASFSYVTCWSQHDGKVNLNHCTMTDQIQNFQKPLELLKQVIMGFSDLHNLACHVSMPSPGLPLLYLQCCLFWFL